MEKLGLNLGFFLFQVFNFLIMMILLYAWAYKPVMNMLENRKRKIAQSLEDANVAAEARANAEKDAKKILDEAHDKAAQIVREATQRAEVAGRDVRAAVEAEAIKARESALADLDQERTRILGDLRGQVAALSIAAAQKLVQESLDEKRQRALIEQFFSGVKDGKVVILSETSSLVGATAEITSALPLTEKEQETVKKDVLAKAGAQTAVSFRVDPSILGGLVIRVGDKVLDDSVVGRLNALKETLR